VGAKTIEKIEAAGINSVEKLAGMTPEQLMEIPGIGEKMVDKIYQAVNRFYEGGAEAAAATGEAAVGGETPAEEGEAAGAAEAEAGTAETTIAPETADAVEENPAETGTETIAEVAPATSEGDAEQAEEAKS
jgi:N utilization substance protein A